MEKLLITGASGFLGFAVTREIAAVGGYDIYAITTGRRPAAFPPGVHAVTADLLDRAQSHRLINETCPELMLHLAWELSGPGYHNSDTNLVWLEESLYMLRSFIESGGKYFAFAGSSSEYGRSGGFSENGGKNAVSLYGQCKNAFHNTASKYTAVNNAGYANLRFFPALGRGANANTAAAAAAAAAFVRGEHFECKAPYNVWDFISAGDAAKAALAVLIKKYNGTVNIGSGIPRAMGNVFAQIAEKMNCSHLLSIDYGNKSSEILVADTCILNNVIGYKCSYDFNDTLDDLIAAIREREKENADKRI